MIGNTRRQTPISRKAVRSYKPPNYCSPVGPWWSRAQALVLSASTIFIAFLSVTIPVQASIELGPGETRLVQGNTGTAPFDGNNNPGNDSNANNNIVRTFDTVTYEVVYVISGSSDQVTVEVTLASDRVDGLSGQTWTELPGLCAGPGSVINGNTLTCNLGDIVEPNGGSLTGRLTVVAQVTGDTPNGAQISASANIQATGEPTTDLGTLTNTVSATPKPDLSKTGISDASDPDRGINPKFVGIRPDPSGASVAEGAVYTYPLALLVGGGKGGEALQGTLSITDSLANYSSNARLYIDSDGNSANNSDYNDDDNGCNWNGTTGLTGVDFINELPYGKTTANAGGGTWDDERAVPDSGTWTCTQAGPGQDIEITISGADLSGTQLPSQTRNGSGITATDSYLISGVVMIWLPLSDVTDGNLDVTNEYDAITVTGVSNTTVTESGSALTNNDTEHTIVAGAGGFNTYYINSASNDDRNVPVPGQTETNSGNGSVLPGQTFGKRITAINNGIAPWSSNDLDPFILCDKIDNQTQVITEITPGTGIAHTVDFDPNDNDFNYTVQYGTGDYTTPALDPDTEENLTQAYENQRLAQCRDQDSDDWYIDINAIPGATFAEKAAKVTKVRFIANEPFLPDSRVNFYLNLTARSQEPDGDPIDPGRILSNHSAHKVDLLSSSFRRGSYRPFEHDTSLSRGDRLFLTRAIARVEKFVNGTNPSASVQADQTVTFNLNPTLSAPITTTLETTLTLTDTLPNFLVYQTGTDTGCDAGAVIPCQLTVQPNSDGTTTLTWNWTNVSPGDTIPDLSFDALASPLATTGTTLTNTAVISTPDDFTPEIQRTSFASVTIINPSAFGIFKETITPLLNANGEMTFNLFLANTGDQDVSNGLFIDVFPYNNDGRTPESSFTGTLGLGSITGSNGETFQFTNEQDRAQLNSSEDPNLITGVIWCELGDFGMPGCPAVGGSDVTAALITVPNFPSGDPVRKVELKLQTTGATGENIYTNSFRGLPEGLGVVTSNAIPVTVQVSVPEVLLVKRITAINGNRIENPNDQTPLNQFVDDTTSIHQASDNHPNWPSNYLLGELNAGPVKPGDLIEYTVYFLNSGEVDVEGVRICDLIQSNQTFQLGTYSSLDAQLQLGDGTGGNLFDLTAANDATDRAQFILGGNTVAANCNLKGVNDNGTLMIDITGNTGTPTLTELPHSVGTGTPNNSYGFVRFVTQVNE